MDSILFLDFDGVLNDHTQFDNGYCGISQSCVEQLNRIIEDTDCKIVLSSAWRYLILNHHMTLAGFEVMMLTHGINACGRLLGLTEFDQDKNNDNSERGNQIMKYLCDAPLSVRWAILDDMPVNEPPEVVSRFVQTDGEVGLTATEADKVIQLLGASP